MTTPVQTPIVELLGNGVSLSFPFPYYVQESAHLRVYVDGVLQAGGYTVAGLGNPAGGSVDFAVAPGNGLKVLLRRAVPLSQLADYVPYDPFPAEVNEQTLDKLTQIAQDLSVFISGTIHAPDSELPGAPLLLPPPSVRASSYLGFDATGAITTYTPGTGGSVAISVAMTPVVQAATLAAGRAAFGLNEGMSTGTIVAAKGDIITATANDAPAILSVGQPGQSVRADPAQATGLIWTDFYDKPNLVINPNWLIDQIREGSLATVNTTSVRGPDGWSGNAVGAGVFKLRVIADPDDASQRCLEITCTTADAAIAAADSYMIYTVVEGYDAAFLRAGTAGAQSITAQFKFKTNITGTYGISVGNAAANRRYVGSINVLNVNENEYSVTLTLDTAGVWNYTNDVGFSFRICLAAGTNFQAAPGAWAAGAHQTIAGQCNFMSNIANIAYLKRVQIIPGTLVQAYKPADIQRELARAQRYYAKTYNQGIAPGSIVGSAEGCFAGMTVPSTGSTSATWKHPVTLRGAPTVTPYSYATGASGKARDLASNSDVNATLTTGVAHEQTTLSVTGTGSNVVLFECTSDARLS